MKINTIIIYAIAASTIFGSQKHKINKAEKNKINQAKALTKNGLEKESLNVYYQLFENSPYLREAFTPLKSILKEQENWTELEKISDLYLNANKKVAKKKFFHGMKGNCISRQS